MEQFDAYKAEQCAYRRFEQETVELDGRIFDRCTFENCTLVFRGRQHFDIKPGCIMGFHTLAIEDNARDVLVALAVNFDDARILGLLADLRQHLPPPD